MSDKVSATPESLRAALVRLWVPTGGAGGGNTACRACSGQSRKPSSPAPAARPRVSTPVRLGAASAPSAHPAAYTAAPLRRSPGQRGKTERRGGSGQGHGKHKSQYGGVLQAARAGTAQNAERRPRQPRCKPRQGSALQTGGGHGVPQAGPARGADVELVDAQAHQHGQRGGAQQAGRIRRACADHQGEKPLFQ